MIINFKKNTYFFLFPFKINHGIRIKTDFLQIELYIGGKIYKGEATFPPYLPETQESAIRFLEKVNWEDFDLTQNPKHNYSKISNLSDKDYFAKAIADMVLWDYFLQTNKFTFYNNKNPISFYTISNCEDYEMRERFDFGYKAGFRAFKLKLNGENDIQMINTFRSLSNLPFAVDVNCGWNDIEYAFDISYLLKEKGCVLIEQPFLKNCYAQKLKFKKILPVIADESFQNNSDINMVEDCYDGGNIKILKCGGLTPALEIAEEMKSKDMKILIGCMSEGKIGCDMAANLSGFADWIDLDGPWLIK